MTDVAQISEVRLLGPALPGGDGRSLWVARLSARLDQRLQPNGDFMRNASLRVLSEAGEAREGYKAVTDHRLDWKKTVALRDPRLIALAVRPEPAWYGALYLESSFGGENSFAHSIAITSPKPVDPLGAYALATAAPLLEKGRWPEKHSPEIETPPLRLAEGRDRHSHRRTCRLGPVARLGTGQTDPHRRSDPNPVGWR